ncbi:hypothetical protein ACJX0J_038866, partial [Zea mays]
MNGLDFDYIEEDWLKAAFLDLPIDWKRREVWAAKDYFYHSIVSHGNLALYHEYYGDKQGALENLIQCGNWKKAHTIFVTSVAHSMFLSSNHQEVWRITSALENHKYEIADWDLGAGIYIDFYVLKNSMQERNAMDDSDSLEEMSESCRSFFGRLNESLLVWGSKLPVES